MPKRKGNLTQERIREILDYNPETGHFISKKTGLRVGSVDIDQGYRELSVDGVCYREHRIIWLYVHGHFPHGVIDHINRDKGDNRLDNLRDVSIRENARNKAKSRNRGQRLITDYSEKLGMWRARVRLPRRQNINLGYFKSKDECLKAYDEYIGPGLLAFAVIE